MVQHSAAVTTIAKAPRSGPPRRYATNAMPPTASALMTAAPIATPISAPPSTTKGASASNSSGPGLLTSSPTVLEADVQVPSSGRCWLKTSRARITKNASSPTGIHSRRIARTVATTIGTSARATQATKHQNAVRSRVRVPGRAGSVRDIDTCSGAATRRTDEHRRRQTDLQHAGHAVACRLRYRADRCRR